MTVPDEYVERVVQALERDIVATLGWDDSFGFIIDRNEELHREDEWESAVSLGFWLVENVQQEFHDTFVDTTWPACPWHHRHPLWLKEEGDWCVWRCTSNGQTAASLG